MWIISLDQNLELAIVKFCRELIKFECVSSGVSTENKFTSSEIEMLI